MTSELEKQFKNWISMDFLCVSDLRMRSKWSSRALEART